MHPFRCTFPLKTERSLVQYFTYSTILEFISYCKYFICPLHFRRGWGGWLSFSIFFLLWALLYKTIQKKKRDKVNEQTYFLNWMNSIYFFLLRYLTWWSLYWIMKCSCLICRVLSQLTHSHIRGIRHSDGHTSSKCHMLVSIAPYDIVCFDIMQASNSCDS